MHMTGLPIIPGENYKSTLTKGDFIMTDTLMEKALMEGYREDIEDPINPKKLTLVFIGAFILVSALAMCIYILLDLLIQPTPWYLRLFPFLG